MTYVQYLEKLHPDDVGQGLSGIEYAIRDNQEIHDGFADGQMVSQDHIDFYALFVRYEDKNFRPEAYVYKVFLPTCLSVSNYFSIFRQQQMQFLFLSS